MNCVLETEVRYVTGIASSPAPQRGSDPRERPHRGDRGRCDRPVCDVVTPSTSTTSPSPRGKTTEESDDVRDADTAPPPPWKGLPAVQRQPATSELNGWRVRHEVERSPHSSPPRRVQWWRVQQPQWREPHALRRYLRSAPGRDELSGR